MSRLRRCTIEGVGLITRADVAFADGLTIFSGETGSGKTMLLGALKLALGERASPDLVARGAPAARVSLEVEADDGLRNRLERDGFELDPEEDAIFTREISTSGKSSARINGRPATAAQLRSYGETLVDLIGQHEQQRLLSGSYQADLLDRYAGAEAIRLRERVGEAYARIAEIDGGLREAEEDAGRALAEAEFARFAAAEIAEANLSDEEERSLRERRDYLANAERIAAALETAREALTEGDDAATEALGVATTALGAVARVADVLASLAERASALQSDATDLAAAIARELERGEFDPAESETIGGRLDLIERLKKKYGASVADVLAAGERFAGTAAAFEARDERAAALRAERADWTARLAADAERLSALRAEAARRLEQAVATELTALSMKHARFEVSLERLDAIGSRGWERTEFLLAPNRGEQPRALARSASGGELSRVLLALVVVLAGTRDGATLVFDEIDAGIGGATANAVAVRLSSLARSAQVVCVTHLAQIASWADSHVALRKRELRSNAVIEAVPLGPSDVLEEVARMLSGSTDGVALEHAKVLLQEVGSRKKPQRRSA